MEKIIEAMLEKNSWAVVGAHPSPEKFGNKVFKKLKRYGHNVIPVNPVYDDVEGIETFESLLDVDQDIECVSVIVSPERAMKVVEDAIKKGIKYMWFQPGAFNEAVIDYAESNGIEVVYHACVLVELDKM